MVDRGVISSSEAEGHPQANVITRAVGADSDTVELEKRTGRLLPGDRLLLCSDGLSKTLPDEQLASLLADHTSASAERLVDAALEARVSDNVTALVVEFDGVPNPVGANAHDSAGRDDDPATENDDTVQAPAAAGPVVATATSVNEAETVATADAASSVAATEVARSGTADTEGLREDAVDASRPASPADETRRATDTDVVTVKA